MVMIYVFNQIFFNLEYIYEKLFEESVGNFIFLNLFAVCKGVQWDVGLENTCDVIRLVVILCSAAVFENFEGFFFL